MTLRPCTVTKLDDTFWRVDWEGDGVHHDFRFARSPAIIRYRGPASYWFDGGTSGDSIDDALARVGLTRREPKPETAEERVRRIAAMEWHEGDVLLGGCFDGMTAGDLRAVLAELDRLRKENEDGSFSKGREAMRKDMAEAFRRRRGMHLTDEEYGDFVESLLDGSFPEQS